MSRFFLRPFLHLCTLVTGEQENRERIFRSSFSFQNCNIFFFLRSKACMYLEVRLNYKIRKKEKEENSSSNETCFVNDETYRFVLLLS